MAAYARVSTEQDEQQSSYEAQIDYYTNYIKNHDAETENTIIGGTDVPVDETTYSDARIYSDDILDL